MLLGGIFLFLLNFSPPTDGLIAWYGFENEVLDYVGGYDGVLDGGATFELGKIGQAVSFDGIDDRIKLPDNNPVWLPNGTEFTLAAWVYFDAAASVREFVFDMNYGWSGESGRRLGYSLTRNEQGEVDFWMTIDGVNENLTGEAILDPGRWYHLVVVRNGTSQEIYVNGTMDDSRICRWEL